MTGREKVVKWLNEYRASNLPKLSTEYHLLPAGYRKLVAVQAGMAAAADKRLVDLTEAERKKLLEANHRISALAGKASSILFGTIWAKA